MINTILAAILVIVVVALILVALLLFIKTKLTPSGSVTIDINNGKKVLEVPMGGNILGYRKYGGFCLQQTEKCVQI